MCRSGNIWDSQQKHPVIDQRRKEAMESLLLWQGWDLSPCSDLLEAPFLEFLFNRSNILSVLFLIIMTSATHQPGQQSNLQITNCNQLFPSVSANGTCSRAMLSFGNIVLSHLFVFSTVPQTDLQDKRRPSEHFEHSHKKTQLSDM